mgnify:CR=1 FL=1
MWKSNKDIFFDLFEQQIANVHKGTHLFYEMIGNYQDVEAKVKAIKAVEKEGDEIVRRIMNELNSTFIPAGAGGHSPARAYDGRND